MKAIYKNKALNETYVLAGIKNLKHAFSVYKTVCQRMNWNAEMFCNDVQVKLK
jgi:hypothetical protein